MYRFQDKKGKSLNFFVGIITTFLCLIFIYHQVEMELVLEAFGQFRWPFLIVGLVCLFIGYAFRVVRWSIMLSAVGDPITWQNCSVPFLGSIAINNIMPFRLGDIVRAIVFPSAMGITKTTSTGSLILERLLDLITILALLFISLSFLEIKNLPLAISDLIMIMTASAVMIFIIILVFKKSLLRFVERNPFLGSPKKSKKVFSKVIQLMIKFLDVFKIMSKPRVLIFITFTSVIVWLGEAGLFFFVLLGFGINGTPIAALFVMSFATLSTLLPSSPGYVGPFHLATFSAIILLGETSEIAGSFAILSHLSIWIPTTLIGAIAISIRPSLFFKQNL